MWVEDDTMENAAALPRLLQAARRQRPSKSLQLPNTALHGDGRHGGDHLNLLHGHVGTTSHARIARSSTYVRCQGGYDICRPSRCFQDEGDIWRLSEQLWGGDSEEGGEEEEAKDKKEVEDNEVVEDD